MAPDTDVLSEIAAAQKAAAAPAPVQADVVATQPVASVPQAQPATPATASTTKGSAAIPSQPQLATNPSESGLALPVTVIGRVDVGRLMREMQSLDAFLSQSDIRQPGTPTKLPKTSKLLDETILNNKVNVLIPEERAKLVNFLNSVYNRAPVMHISFSADPSPVFIQKLAARIRRQIHPLVLIQIGLQPNIGAGCTVRTVNKYFDFSLRHRFHEKRESLIQYLGGVVG